MRLGSRIVVNKGEHIGKTGTIMDYKKGSDIIIGFDDGTSGEFKKSCLLEIDDMGTPKYEKGKDIFSATNNMSGNILEEEGKLHTIQWVDGTTTTIELNQEKDYLIIE